MEVDRGIVYTKTRNKKQMNIHWVSLKHSFIHETERIVCSTHDATKLWASAICILLLKSLAAVATNPSRSFTLSSPPATPLSYETL